MGNVFELNFSTLAGNLHSGLAAVPLSYEYADAKTAEKL